MPSDASSDLWFASATCWWRIDNTGWSVSRCSAACDIIEACINIFDCRRQIIGPWFIHIGYDSCGGVCAFSIGSVRISIHLSCAAWYRHHHIYTHSPTLALISPLLDMFYSESSPCGTAKSPRQPGAKHIPLISIISPKTPVREHNYLLVITNTHVYVTRPCYDITWGCLMLGVLILGLHNVSATVAHSNMTVSGGW